jgi:Transposase DDE domain
MERLERDVLARVPLAEAVLLVWSHLADEPFLRDLFQRQRGRCYQKVLSFPVLVSLIADALLEHGGSGRQSFERAVEDGQLQASIQAAYGKLGRLPIPLSEAFLAQGTERLRALFPEGIASPLPSSLRGFSVVVLDGKAIKQVAKRLKPLRGVTGGVLGGKALVALALDSGLAVAMSAHPDGEINEIRLVPDVLPQVRQAVSGTRLWVADRQFCDLEQTARFTAEGDHFLVRYHPKVQFHADPTRPAQCGRDRRGHNYVEEWGWLGSERDRRRRYVRRITLERPGQEDVILVTDLIDPLLAPAVDLLELYLGRWGIERMFQQVTEVFRLQRLIGGSPQATVFQCAFCLLLYNVVQVVRAYVAVARGYEPERISTEKLFYDVQRELITWSVLGEPVVRVTGFERPGTVSMLMRRLKDLLGAVWTDRWLKASVKKCSSPPTRRKLRGGHSSVHRILENHRNQRKVVQQPRR